MGCTLHVSKRREYIYRRLLTSKNNMMKHILLFAGAMFLAVGMFAQETPAQNTGEKENAEQPVLGPKMSLESSEVDYGEIEQNSDPLRSVKFTNTGNEPLIILNAKGSCGCTVPTYPREPIAPGESAEIEIRYDTKRLGAINKTVKVTTNDPEGEYVIRVKGNISPKPEEEGLPEKEGIFNNPNN